MSPFAIQASASAFLLLSFSVLIHSIGFSGYDIGTNIPMRLCARSVNTHTLSDTKVAAAVST